MPQTMEAKGRDLTVLFAAALDDLDAGPALS
jgi:hypothetical protein